MPGPVGGPPVQGIGGAGGKRGKGIPRVRFEIKGLKRALNDLERVGKDVIETAVKATEVEVKKLLEEAKQETPKDQHNLVNSGRMFKPRVSMKTGQVSFQVAFGGIVARGKSGPRFVDYAVLVHETHRTKRFWLDRTAAKHLPGMPDRIAKEINKVLR